MGGEAWGIGCDPLLRTRFVQGDFVGGEGDGAQTNLVRNRGSHYYSLYSPGRMSAPHLSFAALIFSAAASQVLYTIPGQSGTFSL